MFQQSLSEVFAYLNLILCNWISDVHLLSTKYMFLECKVKWALGSITTNKANGGDGIPVELLQILR